MTMMRGVRILASPCCGAHYAFPCYVSMNFSASEYWTDGWREHSLMPNDVGLRRCTCGRFVMLSDMLAVDTADASDLPYMDRLPDELLPECIASASSEEIEIVARLGYWRHLNHGYRVKYRLHRDAEELATQTAWQAANPDRRTGWDKRLRKKPPEYSRPPNSPFTYPSFEPSEEQLQNMTLLSKMLLDWVEVSRSGYIMELAELYRQLGRFAAAESVILTIGEDQAGVASQLISGLIKERQSAPLRYRM